VDAALVQQQDVQSLHRLRHKVSTLFLNIKGGFDNVELSALLSLLCHRGVSPYLIQWIGSFLRDCTCRLTFQGSPRTFTPVSVRVLQGSPISPLLFVIYIFSLHMDIPSALTISYVDDFAITVASPAYSTNVCPLQKAFSALKRKATPRNISFSIPKTEVIHWRTPRENQPPCRLPVHLEGQIFYPQTCLKWLGFLFTPLFDPRAHFSLRLSLANGAFTAIRRLSPPGIGLPPTSVLPSHGLSLLLFSYTVWLYGNLSPPFLTEWLSFGDGSAGGLPTAFLPPTRHVSTGRHATPTFSAWSATNIALQA